MTEEPDYIKDMLAFLRQQIDSAKCDVDCLLEVPMLRSLGLFVEAVIEQHEQVLTWAEQVLLRPTPQPDDEAGLALWISCYRLFRRTVKIYRRHPNFMSEWFTDDPS